MFTGGFKAIQRGKKTNEQKRENHKCDEGVARYIILIFLVKGLGCWCVCHLTRHEFPLNKQTNNTADREKNREKSRFSSCSEGQLALQMEERWGRG